MGRTRCAPGVAAVLALACGSASPQPKLPRGVARSSTAPALASAAEPYTFADLTSSPRHVREGSGAIEPLPPECKRGDAALSRVAERLARSRLRGSTTIDAAELAFALRAEGSPYVRPLAWTLESDDLTSESLRAHLHDWLTSGGDGGERRCGFSLIGAPARSVLAAVAVDALADLSPLPMRARSGSWLDVDARLLALTSDAKVIVLGPSGAPFGVPTSIEGERVRARFHADRPGAFVVQLLGNVAGGPRPLLEASVYVDVPPPSSFVLNQAPGESDAPRAGADPELALLGLVNRARESEHRPQLVRSAALDALALEHAEAMQKSRRMAHDVGDGDPSARLAGAGLAVLAAGENVARALDVVRAHRTLWASPSHRENLLELRFDSIGIGIARDEDGSLWVCELFADFPDPPAASH